METMEIIIYIVVAILIGGLVLIFTINFNLKKQYDEFTKEKIVYYQEITSDLLVGEMIKTWDECALGEIELTKSYKITNIGHINKTEVVNELNNKNLCDKISLLDVCGSNIHVADIDVPAIVSISCKNNNLIIS